MKTNSFAASVALLLLTASSAHAEEQKPTDAQAPAVAAEQSTEDAAPKAVPPPTSFWLAFADREERIAFTLFAEDPKRPHIVLNTPEGVRFAVPTLVMANGLSAAWGDASHDAAQWAELWAAFRSEVDALSKPPVDPPAVADEPAADAAGPQMLEQPPVRITMPFPGVTEVQLSSKGVATIGKVSSILFAVAPGEVTAVGAIAAKGLTLLDRIGGGHGVTILTAVPFIQETVVLPAHVATSLGRPVGRAFKVVMHTVKRIPGRIRTFPPILKPKLPPIRVKLPKFLRW